MATVLDDGPMGSAGYRYALCPGCGGTGRTREGSGLLGTARLHSDSKRRLR